MTSRIGTCAGCGANFKIPETFTGTRGKCKKCGGVVEIPAIEEAAAEEVKPKAPAPAAKAAAGAAAPTRRAGGAAGGRSARGRPHAARGRAPAGRTASRRRGGGDEESEGVQSWVWIVVAASVVGIAVVLFLILSGNDDPEPSTTDLASATNTTPDIVEPDSEPVEETVPEEAPVEEPVEPEVADDTTAAPAVSPEELENVDPVIKLDPLPSIIGCDQEVFDRLTECFTDGFVKEELPRFKRAPLLDEFDEAEWKPKIPILLNSFNGLDLLKPNDVALAFRIAEMWNKMTGAGFVDVPVKGDTTDEEMEANLYYNVKNIYAIYSIWEKKIDDVDAQQDFFEKCERWRAKAAAKEGDG